MHHKLENQTNRFKICTIHDTAPYSQKNMGTFFEFKADFKICLQTGFGADSKSRSSDSVLDCLDFAHLCSAFSGLKIDSMRKK